MRLYTTFVQRLLLLTGILMVCHLAHAQDFYWIGGSGNWDDISHWSKRSGDPSTPTGVMPGENSTVFIDDQSGPTSGFTITIRSGAYEVQDLVVTNKFAPELLFNGTSGSSVSMSVHGDILLGSALTLSYSDVASSNNVWKFVGNKRHNITAPGKDLLNIEILDVGGTFYQRSSLLVSGRIRMYAGTWASNGHDVTSSYIRFRDNQPTSSPFPKVFNTGGSDIYADEWDAKFTYGSLTIVGGHQIFSSKFHGGSAQNNGPVPVYDEIHLLEYSDFPMGFSVIEHNNFECRSCNVENLIIEDTGETKLADEFTINGELRIVNPGSRILFNGGNSRTSNVTLNGTVKTPPTGPCGEKTLFSAAHTDFSVFTRNVGTLAVKDAEIEDIRTEGGATFTLSNSLLTGSSTGWNLLSPPNARDFFWIGPTNGSYGNWGDAANWVLADGGTTNCIPSAANDVYIGANAKGKMRIPANYLARCNNFIWTNKDALELKLDGTNTQKSELEINGNFDLDESAIITATLFHQITFSSSSNNYILTRDVPLPRVEFTGELATWNLQSDLVCDRIRFESGTLHTRNQDVETDYWVSIGRKSKHYILGSSHLQVAGEFALAQYSNSNVTVAPGTSLIECNRLVSSVEELYDLRLNNPSGLTMGDIDYRFNKLILGGAGQLSIINDLTINELVFAVDGSALALNLGQVFGVPELFTLNGGIESLASAGNPGVLKSATSGDQKTISKDGPGNVCVDGPVLFQDIDATMPGVFNAPDGIDNGNNTGITFDDGSGSSDLYWIGNSGDWLDTHNWARIPGGCPDTKSPNDAPRLYFDRYSFTSTNETVTVPTPVTCSELYFTNGNYPANLSITSLLSADLLDVSGGYVNMTGKNLDANETRVQSSGLLSTDMMNFTTGTLETSSGLFIIRSGSNATVNN